MIKWIETGEEDRPRVPLKMTMQSFQKVVDELGVTESELLQEIVGMADMNYKMGRVLWAAVDYGQRKTNTIAFKTDEEFTDWLWFQVNSINPKEIEGLEADELVKVLSKIPGIKILQVVINDLGAYYTKLAERMEKNAAPSRQNLIKVEDHS